MVYLFMPPRKENYNAIEFYVNVLIEAFALCGERVKRIACLEEVKRGDKVVSLTVNDSARVLLTKRGVKVYTWFQGIAPEEMAFNSRGVAAIAKFVLWGLMEFLALWGSSALLFVSEAMVKHYRRKCLFFRRNYVVMPCFNQHLEADAFVQSKYETPSFVYSGSLDKWQCFGKTVKLFSEIKKTIPDAKLAVFTGDVERAEEILEKEGLVDVELRNVPYKELPSQMRRFKYGFLIRDRLILNKVATPTKMSSYLGCGVIPIFSPVIGDFNERLGHLNYIVKASDTATLINKLQELESAGIRAEDVLTEYKTVFDEYYCREKYVKEISRLFDTCN